MNRSGLEMRQPANTAYSVQVLDHFRRPRYGRPLEGEDVRSGEAGSQRRGVLVRFQLRIAGMRIVDSGYQVYGSPYAIAACSLAAEWMIGRAANSGAVPAGRELAAALDLPAERTGDALVVEDALRAALQSET